MFLMSPASGRLLSLLLYTVVLQLGHSFLPRSPPGIYSNYPRRQSVTASGDKKVGNSYGRKTVGDNLLVLKRAAPVPGPPIETKPDYENIHGPLGPQVDKILLTIFRSSLAENIGVDSSLPKDDYQGVMELATALNARFSDRNQVQQIAQNVLRSMFPSWLPKQYSILFSRPFPEFSAKMNAWATCVFGFWLMGEIEINDVETPEGVVYKDQGVLVKRCRFLEESGCASVCVNSCKIPTQNFFAEDMGIPLTMTPDYDTFECQFSFGLPPDTLGEEDVRNTPCLSRCPTAGGMRSWHNSPSNSSSANSISSTRISDEDSDASLKTSRCQLMDDSIE